MLGEVINHGVGLVIYRAGCIVVVLVKVGQPTIVMRFKPFILISVEVSVVVDNDP